MSKTPTPTAARQWATLEQAAEYLACSVYTVRRYISTGALPAYRVGGTLTIRVKWSDLDALFAPIPTAGGVR